MASYRLIGELAEGQQDGQVRCALARHARHVHVVLRRQCAGRGEVVQCVLRQSELRAFGVRSGQVEVAPVDAQIVAGAVEHALIAGADVEHGEALRARAAPGDGLVRGVDGDDRVYVDQDGQIVVVFARGAYGEVSHGAGEDVEVFGKCRREEADREADAGGTEL